MAVPAVIAAVVEKAAEVIPQIIALIESVRSLVEKMQGPETQTIMRMQAGRE